MAGVGIGGCPAGRDFGDTTFVDDDRRVVGDGVGQNDANVGDGSGHGDLVREE